MFDIGISEMMVIAAVALIVIGPERLPKVARTLGHLWGRAQRYINGVKADIARDMAVEEFRQLQQQVQQEADSMKQAASGVEQMTRQAVQSLGQQSQQISNVGRLVPPDQSSPEQIHPEQIHPEQIHPEQIHPEQKKFPVD